MASRLRKKVRESSLEREITADKTREMGKNDILKMGKNEILKIKADLDETQNIK
jgi:hypothetical protein